MSYLLTWQEDQSIMSAPDMLDKGVEVSNAAGKIGYRWGYFLVCRFLGLGSFALIFLLGVSAFRLFFWNRSIGFLRMTLISVSGAFLSSLILSFISLQFTSDVFFGGGLGGDAGHGVIVWLENLVGPIVVGVILLVLTVVWGLFVSGRFAHWFAVAGMEKKQKVSVDDFDVKSLLKDNDEVKDSPEEEISPEEEAWQNEIPFGDLTDEDSSEQEQEQEPEGVSEEQIFKQFHSLSVNVLLQHQQYLFLDVVG